MLVLALALVLMTAPGQKVPSGNLEISQNSSHHPHPHPPPQSLTTHCPRRSIPFPQTALLSRHKLYLVASLSCSSIDLCTCRWPLLHLYHHPFLLPCSFYLSLKQTEDIRFFPRFFLSARLSILVGRPCQSWLSGLWNLHWLALIFIPSTLSDRSSSRS